MVKLVPGLLTASHLVFCLAARCSLPVLLCVSVGSFGLSRSAEAAEYIIDTDALTITNNGVAWDFGGTGTLIASSVNNQGIAEFVIGGNLILSQNDTLRGIGNRPAALFVGNNVDIATGSTIDFSALINVAGPGGGVGGTGGDGGAGGARGAGAVGGSGGAGGFGSVGFGPIPIGLPPVVRATPGNDGLSSVIGRAGAKGQEGEHGANGFNASGAGQAGAVSTQLPIYLTAFGGTGGSEGSFPPIPSVIPGQGAIICAIGQTLCSDGHDGAGGSKGANAPSSLSGLQGGAAQNIGSGFELSGGGGGAGGSGGGGGHGGAGGSSGGGGAGGQGAWPTNTSFFPYWIGIGGEGGDGGRGGNGGIGGFGGIGGSGAQGGAGGGALAVNALGTIRIDGSAHARGGDGATGTPGTAPQDPGVGFPGTSGQFTGVPGVNFSPPPFTGILGWAIPIPKPSIGSSGGDGGQGGNGGDGGAGGAGGNGGGGAGGTLKLVGSAIVGSGNVHTGGGLAGDVVTSAGNGRFLLGANNVATGSDSLSVLGTTGAQSSQTQLGNLSANPFVASTPSVPNLVNTNTASIVGGAEAYGRTTLQADTTALDGFGLNATLLSVSPQNAVAGAIRLDEGPAAFLQDYDGYDMILVYNTLTSGLTNVQFGANLQELDPSGNPVADPTTLDLAPFHAFPLLDGGWANDPAFGGLGDVLNGSLDGYEVYATLVPEDTTNEGLNFAFSVENAGNTFVATLDKFANGDTLFAEFNPNVAVLESTWVGSTGIGGAGTWNAASHWSTVDANGNLVANVVPNNSTAQAFNVNINSGQADVAQDTLITIDRLSIGNGDALTVLDEQRLILERFSVRSASGTIENNGTITLGATGSNPLNPTAMRLSGTGLQFDGAGTLTSTDNANNQLTGIRQTDSVTNGANHTIEMVGQLGGDSLKITNQGTIRAMVSATNAELVINPSGTSTNEAARFINEGTVVADGAGRVLRVLDGRMDHREGATLTATNGGTLLIDNSTLDIAPNSTVSATGSGSVLEVTGGSVVNLNSGSQLFTDNGGQLNFRGSTMTNRGEILGSTHLQNMTIDNRGGGFESDSPITVGGDLLLQGGFFLAELQSHATEISSSIALADVTLEAGASLNSTNEFGLKGDIVSLTVLADFSTDGDMRIGGNGRPTALIGEFELGFSSLEPASPGVAETLVIDNSTIATINDLGSVGWKVNSNVTLDNQGDVTISRTSGPQLSWFGEIINRGTIRSQTSHASNIAVRYAGLTLDNEGGILIDGSFDNVVVTGGEIRSELGVETPHADFRHLTLTGPGTVDIFSGDFDSVTNNLSNAVLSGEFITLRNRFTNNGLFSFSEDVQIQGDLILDGTGIGEITDGIGGPDGATLTIGLSRLYIGGGIFQPQTIGNNELFIVNTSLITGDPPQFVFDDEEPYTIDPKGDRFSATPGVVNEGAMEHVWLEDAHVDNRQGTLAGVSLRGTRIVGGEVLSSPLADVRILTHSVLEDVTLGGTVDVQADLELRGTHLATGATTPVIDLNGGNLIVAGDVSVDGIRIDLKSQQLIGTPADRLTIESGAELMTSGATTTLNLGPTTPSIINHGAILLDNMVGTPITETVTAGTENFSEVAYVAATGGDLTGMDPTSTITVPVDVDFTSKPLIKNYGTIGNGLSFETGLIGVAIENHGTFIGRIALIDSEVINTSSAPISLTLLHDSALIGGETAPDTLPIQISGDSSFVDVTVNAQNIWLNADNASLTLTGSSQVDPNDLDLGSMVVNGDVTTDPNQIFMEVVLRGNVTVGSAASIVIDTFGSTFAVEATLPANVQSGSFAGVVNNGSISLGSFGVDVELSGRFENNGSFTAPGSTADLTIGAGTYTNNGTWSMPDRLVPLPTGATFHAAPTSTLNTLGLVLDGGILAAESDWIDASAPPITWNTGGIRLTNASGHVIGSGGFVDTHLGGTTTSMPTGKSLLVDNTLTIPLGASLTLNGGTVEAGTIDHTYGGSLVVNAGRLSAATVFGAVAISGATYSPQGTSSMSGAYSQDATSTFEMAIGGSAAGEFDSLNVAGAVSLDGSLVVILEDDFSPALGDTFTVVSSPIGISGTFDATQFPAVDPLLAWAAFYEPNAITLAIAPALTGDFNGDGSVDAADFTVWRDNFGASGPGLVADADLNGVVNNDDLNLWKTNFGNSANVLAVPEPDFAAFALFLFAVAIATFRTRSRQSG